MEKMLSGFPSDDLQLFCLSVALYFGGTVISSDPVLQPQLPSEACVLLSGTSVSHRVEAELLKDIILIKYDSFLLKLLFCAPLSFISRSSGSRSR